MFFSHNRYSFPFGRPEGALKATLSLLERVLMKDSVTPVPQEEVKALIKKCLEKAALVNYTKLSAEAKIEDDLSGEVCVPPSKKLEDLIHLAELCVDLLQQNEEHYSEVLVGFLELSVDSRSSRERGSACFEKHGFGKDPQPPQKTNAHPFSVETLVA